MSDFILKRFDQTVKKYQIEKLPQSDPSSPPQSFLDGLDDKDKKQLTTLHDKCREGQFPDLWDFSPKWGGDLSGCRNIDAGVWCLGDDGSGSIYVMYPGGKTDSWSHESGGQMEDHTFSSLDGLMECLVTASGVKEGNVDWGDVRDVFEHHAQTSTGWAYFLDDIDEFVRGG